MGDDELLPCPFCGSTDLAHGSAHRVDGKEDAIMCMGCGCRTVKRIWNTRYCNGIKVLEIKTLADVAREGK